MRLCELLSRFFVYGFVGLNLALLVDFPELAILTAFVAAFVFYAADLYVYPRFADCGSRRLARRAAITFVVGQLIGIACIGLPLLARHAGEPMSIDLLRVTVGWGGALGLGVSAIGTVLYGFQALAAKNEEQKRLLAETAKQAAELRELVVKAENSALRAQINPHFLFNALNTLAYLTEEDPPAARRVVEKLARIFRRTLERSFEPTTTLAEELEFVADYLAIEVERFDDVLRVQKIVDPETLRARVPTTMIQPLAENSIKHGICPVANGGTLTLRTDRVESDDGPRLRIVLEDDGRGMDESRLADVMGGSAGVGLANVRERLRLHYGDRASVSIRSRLGEGTRVTIELPYETATVDQPAVASQV
jgi:signal transduction histidine kinase